jgi:hypothetical protein
MKFKNYINEVLSKKTPLTNVSSPGAYQLRFKAAGEEWMFLANDTTFSDDWDIYFTKVNVDPLDPWTLKGDIGSKVFEVFAGVAESLKKFIKENDPEYFHFTAQGESRIKLYKKLSKLIERKTGYEHITTKTKGKSVIFYFSK